jgi:hypothetical protein
MVCFTAAGDGGLGRGAGGRKGMVRTIFGSCFRLGGRRYTLEPKIRGILEEFEEKIKVKREEYDEAGIPEECPAEIKARAKDLARKSEVTMKRMRKEYKIVLEDYKTYGLADCIIEEVLEDLEAANKATFKKLQDEKDAIALMAEEYVNNHDRVSIYPFSEPSIAFASN